MKYKYLVKLVIYFVLINKMNLVYAIPNNINYSNKTNQTNSNKQPNSTKKSLKNSVEKDTSSNLESMDKIIRPKLKNNVELTDNPHDNLNADQVVLNFENADIQSVIKAISQLSGKNFVIDPRVKGTINIVSDKPISKNDSYRVLESALRMQGFASVEADGVVKVLPESEAKTYGMKTYTQQYKLQAGDQIITKIFVITHGSAMQLSNALRPLIAPNNSISVYPNSNAIIVTDYASNLTRIGKIINQLSSSSSSANTPVIITLKNAMANDVAQVLQSYLQGGGATASGSNYGNSGGAGNTDGPNTTITVDLNTNSIIIYSVIEDKLNELKKLALQLDENTGKTNNNLHVVYLKNGDAIHIAEVLRVIATSQDNPDIEASSSMAKFTNEPNSAFGSAAGTGIGGSSTSGGGSANNSQNRISSNNKALSNNTQKESAKIFVQAEPSTNSLIIQAPDALYRNLRMIIDMLDVRRAQVYIEAMIVNINATKGGAFGIQWLLGAGNNNLGGIVATNYGGSFNGGSSANLTNVITNGYAASQGKPATFPNEVLIGLTTGTTTIGGQQVPTLGAIADAIDAHNAGNILSRPTLITLDNEEAHIMVGQNIGIPNGSYQTNAGNPVTTYTRQDLGTSLQIKPLITESGSIQLDIFQEDSKIDPSSINSDPAGPKLIKQNMRAHLLVDDGQIIALGGMTQDSITFEKNGIPLLGSIPYIGWLFSWQSRIHEKKNLVLFLRPVIIKSKNGYAALTNNRYKYIVDKQNEISAKGNLILPEIKAVNLENQMPYKYSPTQDDVKSNQVTNLPIVDLRSSSINKDQKNLDPQVDNEKK